MPAFPFSSREKLGTDQNGVDGSGSIPPPQLTTEQYTGLLHSPYQKIGDIITKKGCKGIGRNWRLAQGWARVVGEGKLLLVFLTGRPPGSAEWMTKKDGKLRGKFNSTFLS